MAAPTVVHEARTRSKPRPKTKSPLCVGISGLRCGTTAIDSGRLPPAFALAVLGSCPASAS
ncbi:hypothetical protein A8D95_08055 [Burkholderia cenocepacia]|uniref:Uncharacterized protein n=1 Tax=Burkholderia cenocepacia TaxID=95486 RepID=A0A1V2XAR7_9BURK|nr:hypothetical protein A8D61_00620 [Burkholderia cenocepacia]OXI72123.1 hypothetical protein CFB44_19850 [Burkholderia sp. AU31280]AQQ40031.1 hypothetical protein A8E75_04790 [Burkholderia cenocepacia]AQQ47867.1 hypothetical protein A8F32_09760 [Burkholderia cenocepacia]ONI98203.1 hypothetical protein A8F33_29675 [Burkholderia cenocepacia]